MLNMTVFQGRTAQDLVLQRTPGGKSYCHLRVAVERDYLTKGERKTDFLSCIVWGETAAFAAKYFKKGDLVTVRGRLEENSWTDKEGNTRSRMIVNVDSLYFGETKRAREERQQRSAGSNDLPPLPDPEDIPPEFFDDAQLPF